MMMRTRRGLWIAAVASVLLLGSASHLHADAKPGIRGGIYSDHGTSGFIGADVLFPIDRHFYFNPGVDVIFPEHGSSFAATFDFHYDLSVESPMYLWIGGGPAVIYFDPEGPRRSDTDFGVDLFFGVGFRMHDSRLIPYIQPKVVLSDESQFSLAFGLRF